MTTLRQIERLWNAKSYQKLFGELVSARPEASIRLEMELGKAVPAAAMAMIRLDEFSQSHTPLYRKLLNEILMAQESDGGWGDLMTTALCVRALLCGQGAGQAIERGLNYLANLQKTEGIWPKIPLRRTVADAFVSAVILFQLGDKPQFRQTVRLDDATNWFDENELNLDAETTRLWDRAKPRCRWNSPADSLWVGQASQVQP